MTGTTDSTAYYFRVLADNAVADVNGDFLFDIVRYSMSKPNYIANVTAR